MTVKVSNKQQRWWVALTELSLPIAATSHPLERNKCLKYRFRLFFFPPPANCFLRSDASDFTAVLQKPQHHNLHVTALEIQRRLFPTRESCLKLKIWIFPEWAWTPKTACLLQTAFPRRAAAAAQLSQRVLLLVPGGRLELLVRRVHKILRPFHVGLNMINKGALFLHQHENVHEKVPKLLHVVLQAQQLLSTQKDNTGLMEQIWGFWS